MASQNPNEKPEEIKESLRSMLRIARAELAAIHRLAEHYESLADEQMKHIMVIRSHLGE